MDTLQWIWNNHWEERAIVLIVSHANSFTPFNTLFGTNYEVLGVDYCAISIAAGNKNEEKVLTIGDARYLGLGCTLTDPLEVDCESSEEERKEDGK